MKIHLISDTHLETFSDYLKGCKVIGNTINFGKEFDSKGVEIKTQNNSDTVLVS